MILAEIMKTEVVTLTDTDTIKSAIHIINENSIRHIPILNLEDCLVGLVTDRDLRDAAPSIFHAGDHPEDLERPVSSIMRSQVITGHPLDFVQETAALFHEHHISCLPVIKAKKLVGIITESDLLHTLVQVTGAHQPGSQIEIRVPNRTGVLSEIATVITGKNSNINSILVYPDKKDTDYKILAIRVQTMNPGIVIDELKIAGYDVLWPNLPGRQL